MTDDLKLTPETDLELEEFFSLAREDAPVPSAGLLARIASDASATQDAFNGAALPIRTPAPRMSWWKQLLDDIGGLPAVGGLAVCACAGLYLGSVNPDLAATWNAEETAEVEGLMGYEMLSDVYWIEEG